MPTRMISLSAGLILSAGVLVVVVSSMLGAVHAQEGGGQRLPPPKRAVVMERSLRATLLPALLKKEGGCNTDPHMCDAKKKEECCRGRCRNVHSNALHCGGCGRSCPQSRSCCTGSCVNLNNDGANCGKCGNVCMSGLSCHRGLCGYDE